MNDKRWNRRQLLRLATAVPAAAALAACTLPVLPLEEASMVSDPPAAESVTITHWQPFSTEHRAAVETLSNCPQTT